MKKCISVLLLAFLFAAVLTSCGQPAVPETASPETTSEKTESTATESIEVSGTSVSDSSTTPLEDGVYSVCFNTDSGMFHVNEACEGRGTLTVEGGKMTVHISLVSKSIVNLFVGTADDAQKNGAEILEPTLDEITYKDGYTEKVNGFDVPVEALDTDFALAIIGKKGTWYDHTVSISDPQPIS